MRAWRHRSAENPTASCTSASPGSPPSARPPSSCSVLADSRKAACSCGAFRRRRNSRWSPQARFPRRTSRDAAARSMGVRCGVRGRKRVDAPLPRLALCGSLRCRRPPQIAPRAGRGCGRSRPGSVSWKRPAASLPCLHVASLHGSLTSFPRLRSLSLHGASAGAPHAPWLVSDVFMRTLSAETYTGTYCNLRVATLCARCPDGNARKCVEEGLWRDVACTRFSQRRGLRRPMCMSGSAVCCTLSPPLVGSRACAPLCEGRMGGRPTDRMSERPVASPTDRPVDQPPTSRPPVRPTARSSPRRAPSGRSPCGPMALLSTRHRAIEVVADVDHRDMRGSLIVNAAELWTRCPFRMVHERLQRVRRPSAAAPLGRAAMSRRRRSAKRFAGMMRWRPMMAKMLGSA